MNGFYLKIVTPQRAAFDGEAERLVVRTREGDTAILPRHAEYAAEVAAGTARVTADGQTRQAETGPGVLTVTHEGTTLLCERFEWK